ncbi:MAG: DEAD/DEAH box helicase [Anaerolineae bacterium]|nr:DEAD/DEAH box helicase [Anaerolineae bacterium]NUQ04748.1 DEAD/DEAH box helicase [Anaerolineae bacterium]
MSLNPVQFGKDVIDQFGRYLLTTFPIADDRLSAQVRERLRHNVGSDPLLYRGPYVYLNRPFEPGPEIESLIAQGKLHPVMRAVFPYESLHFHQAQAVEAVQAGNHLILSTGTGSGKTEAFMLPIVDHCLRLRDENAPPGVAAVLVYPMNALVNDQLERLRWSLAGTRVTFGRYTGETPRAYSETTITLNAPVAYTSLQREQYKDGKADFGSEVLPLPWEECYDTATIREKKPRILLTNYAQLEYLLLRDKDLDLFRGSPLQFIVFDEVHTYTGALGSEVACLIRRLRDVAGKSSTDVTMIGTSATVSSKPDDEGNAIDAEAVTRRFAHRLFGVPQKDIVVVRETYRDFPHLDTYLPPLPNDMLGLLDAILKAARVIQLQTEIEPDDIPAELIERTAALCGRATGSDASGMAALSELLANNRCIARLGTIFDEPRAWDETLPIWRRLGAGREFASEPELIAEMLAYLTLGALATVDGDPLLRPKLHYFVQGLQGLGISFQTTGDPELSFSDNQSIPPLMLCRSCGQHYTRLLVTNWTTSNDSHFSYRSARIPRPFEEPAGEWKWLYLTDRFHTQDDEESADEKWEKAFVCTACQTVHEKNEPRCLNPHCRQTGTLVALFAFNLDGGGLPKRCGACGGLNSEHMPIISYTRSAAVADVTILAQSMLTMMSEQALRKVLIFADSRQEAAFQAGWMDQRAKRFRMRHLAYQIARENDAPLNWDDFAFEINARAMQSGIFSQRDFNDRENMARAHWFLVEELAFVTQRRSNLEQLGLIGITYGDLDRGEDPFFQQWADELGVSPEAVVNVTQLLLDVFRRRGMLSDELLSRWWDNKFPEVFKGIINVPEYYRPSALVLQNVARNGSLKGWRAQNGRSLAQVVTEKSLKKIAGGLRDRFLDALWSWLVDQQYLIPVLLTQRRYGRVEPIPNLPDAVYQVNVNRLGIREVHQRYVCSHCHRAQSVMTNSRNCPEYGCAGTLREEGRDHEHFDVYQYTQVKEFVPMMAREHSAQVPQDRRQEVERQFKSDSGNINTIVATPTLEMGVDIGRLEMAMMRNVPPTPANYAQRAGRAGRRHRIGIVMTYAGSSQHDRYFYADPPQAIAGEVRVPTFSMQNAPLIRKHVHSATLTLLREWVTFNERAILTKTFPSFIRDYLTEWVEDEGQKRSRFFDAAMTFPEFRRLLEVYHSRLLERLIKLFRSDWTPDDLDAVSPAVLETYLREMPDLLERHVRLLFNQVRAYRGELDRLRSIESLNKDEKKRRQRYEQALDSYLREDIGNYALSWLAVDGFFPGYALSRETVQATSLQPFMELSRPAPVALRELTPANRVYADGRIFSVQRMNFGRLKADDNRFSSDTLREEMLFDIEKQRLFSPKAVPTEGGNTNIQSITSYRLTDVEMEQAESINDQVEVRHRIAFDIRGMLMDSHKGGLHGRVGGRQFRFLRGETVRLVNLGMIKPNPVGVQGFPLCPVCGETRSPNNLSLEEYNRFRTQHSERCGIDSVGFFSLHVDLNSDVLCIGPYEEIDHAVNAYEGLLIGARNVLDMSGGELEGFFYPDDTGAIWAVIYDPLPGGTGFFDQLLAHWDRVCHEGIAALERCDCETACYKCLQNFRNQQYHDSLDRRMAIEILADLRGEPQKEHSIPAPKINDTGRRTAQEKAESPAEDQFLALLAKRGFPVPTASQHRVELGNGNFTVADFAWPEKGLLIFIDGTSPGLHGDPDQARRDRNKRRQARMLHYQVVEITAQELKDELMIAVKLEDIEFILSQEI